MTVRIRTNNGTTLEVPQNITLAELQRRLAAQGDGNPSDLNVNWSCEADGPTWGAPWPGADFSGNVLL